MCRIMYTVEKRNAAVSKSFSGEWGRDRFPEWRALIEAALASYQGRETQEEADLLKGEVESFLEVGTTRVRPHGCD